MHRQQRERERERRSRSTSSDESPPPRRERDREQKPKTGLNKYWIAGDGINREVLQRQICFMLGNEAYSKPDKYKVHLIPLLGLLLDADQCQGVDGYRIQAVRPFTDVCLLLP